MYSVIILSTIIYFLIALVLLGNCVSKISSKNLVNDIIDWFIHNKWRGTFLLFCLFSFAFNCLIAIQINCTDNKLIYGIVEYFADWKYEVFFGIFLSAFGCFVSLIVLKELPKEGTIKLPNYIKKINLILESAGESDEVMIVLPTFLIGHIKPSHFEESNKLTETIKSKISTISSFKIAYYSNKATDDTNLLKKFSIKLFREVYNFDTENEQKDKFKRYIDLLNEVDLKLIETRKVAFLNAEYDKYNIWGVVVKKNNGSENKSVAFLGSFDIKEGLRGAEINGDSELMNPILNLLKAVVKKCTDAPTPA